MEPARPLPPFTISEAVTYSWNACLRNGGPAYLLVSLVVFAGNTAVVVLAAANSSAGFQLAFELFGALIDVLLLLGLIRAALDVVDGVTPHLGTVFRPDGYGPYLVASVLFLVGTYLGFILLVVPGLVFAVIFEFYAYVIAEHPDITATGALRRSAEITRGSRVRLLGLAAVLVCLNLAGALCVVGLIVTYAISALALAYVYRALTNQGPVGA
ncbi:MAG TPA: hypothetical protein VLV81_02330 [Acidimicrobiia bacterium]|nr:hypothetical protein [Acidimicrobiia bacterium]